MPEHISMFSTDYKLWHHCCTEADWLMASYSNKVEQLAGWHYLPHPPEHIMSSQKQDLVIYDGVFFSTSIACVDL